MARLNGSKPRVLVVDDESSILITLPAILERHGFAVDAAASASEAIQKLFEGVFQIVITDMRMESLTSGYDVVRAAQMQPYQPATLLLTAFPPEEAEWRASGVGALFEKPVNMPALLKELRAVIERQRIKGGQTT
jgi:DNA-binding response OmpR family regulator